MKPTNNCFSSAPFVLFSSRANSLLSYLQLPWLKFSFPCNLHVLSCQANLQPQLTLRNHTQNSLSSHAQFVLPCALATSQAYPASSLAFPTLADSASRHCQHLERPYLASLSRLHTSLIALATSLSIQQPSSPIANPTSTTSAGFCFSLVMPPFR